MYANLPFHRSQAGLCATVPVMELLSLSVINVEAAIYEQINAHQTGRRPIMA